MNYAALGFAVSIGAFCISIISVYFARKSWFEANRPIVTARVVPISQHNFALNVVLRNTGNRPAKDVRLSPLNPKDLKDKLIAAADDAKRKYVESCFQATIPIIENGREVSANFGSLSSNRVDRTWRDDPCEIEIELNYKDLDGRVFLHRQKLRMTSVDSFGEGVWISDGEKI
jgi:hypothetical protein